MKQETATITTNDLPPEQATQQALDDEANEKLLVRFMIRRLTDAAVAVARTTEEMEAGSADAGKDLESAIARFSKAGEAALYARRRFDKYFGQFDAEGDSHDLDLGAARAEIRRRMDRLRAAGDAGSVPE